MTTDLERENRFLRDENKRLQMKLVALKMLLSHERPVCAEKLTDLLIKCEDCKGEAERTIAAVVPVTMNEKRYVQSMASTA